MIITKLSDIAYYMILMDLSRQEGQEWGGFAY